MTVYVYGEKAGRTHENQMLQAFLERMEERWADSADWVVVIANAMWNGAEIDLVCILPSAVLVADFKSYGGTLSGTENGPWQADGVIVKGGRKANPYQQLRDNKFSVLNWLQSKALLIGRNLGHISAGVIFSDVIEEQLEISPKVRSWFYLTDLTHCAVMLDGLSSPELQIAWNEAQEIIHRLGVQPMEWMSIRPQVRDIHAHPNQSRRRTLLTQHQREALQTLCGFVEAKDSLSFSVLGMTSTGKSCLLAELMDEIKKTDKEAIVLAPNRRLADLAEIKANSIYGHLYTGGVNKNSETEITEEQKKLKVIPLRACDDPEDCVYLLDDVHLLGNARFSTPDGKLYGSGQLLSDFFDFADVGKTKRKLVFFGDPYQIQRGGDESVLSGEFQKARGLKHQSLELTQLIDTTGGSAKLANAAKLVAAIGAQKFAALELETDEGFRLVEKREAAAEILERFRADPGSVWYLGETHARVNVLTQWLRERLHEKKELNPVEEGDLLEVYVSPDARDEHDIDSPRVVIPFGGRILVKSVGQRTEYQQGLSWVKNGPVLFHTITCAHHGRELAVFEEFLTAEKPELDKETAVAESVWRNAEKTYNKKFEEWQKQQEGLLGVELKPQPKPPEKPLPRPDFAYTRYGYASTVHHAQGMSQPVCYVNCDHAAGRHSEGFFRWLYSALTVAERELVLFNFTPIHPFDDAVWNAGSVKAAADIAVGAGWAFQPNGIASERDQQRSRPEGLDQSKDVLKSVAIWLRVVNAAERLGWQVVRAACHPYQEQYELSGPQGEQCLLRIAYNGKNVVTAMHMKESEYWPFLCDLAYECLVTNGYLAEAEALLYSTQSRLDRIGWRIVSAAETPYRLVLSIVRNPDERVRLEINFDKQGLVSSLRPLTCSKFEVVETIRTVF